MDRPCRDGLCELDPMWKQVPPIVVQVIGGERSDHRLLPVPHSKKSTDQAVSLCHLTFNVASLAFKQMLCRHCLE